MGWIVDGVQRNRDKSESQGRGGPSGYDSSLVKLFDLSDSRSPQATASRLEDSLHAESQTPQRALVAARAVGPIAGDGPGGQAPRHHGHSILRMRNIPGPWRPGAWATSVELPVSAAVAP